jgi:GDP-L-fucose synthase
VTGGAGFLGSFIVEKLVNERKVDPGKIRIPRSQEMDLRTWENCVKAVKNVDVVVHLAAKVGGIRFNKKYPATLFNENAIWEFSSWRQREKKEYRNLLQSEPRTL